MAAIEKSGASGAWAPFYDSRPGLLRMYLSVWSNRPQPPQRSVLPYTGLLFLGSYSLDLGSCGLGGLRAIRASPPA